MKANKIALLSLTALLLIACGPTNSNTQTGGDQSSDVTTPDGSDTDTNLDPEIDEEIELVTFGGMYPNSIKTIYASTKNGTDSEFVWTSSNTDVADVTPRTGMSSEGYVYVKGLGKTIITCSLQDYPSIKKTYEVNITEGEAMPLDLYESITKSVKVTTDQYYYSYNSQFFEKENDHVKMTTIYEENMVHEGEDPSTDAYAFKSWTPGKEPEYDFTYVRSLTSNNVSIEDQDIYNRIVYRDVHNKSNNEPTKWLVSPYQNMFGDSSLLSNEDFRTYDNGKTWHYTGYEPQTKPLMNSLYLLNLSPDDMYFEKSEDGQLSFHVVSDPHNEIGINTRYGVKINSVFEEIGTAKVSHYKVYDHKDYHDQIDAALEEIKNSKNYTVDVTYDYPKKGEDIRYVIKRNKDTIHRVKYNEDGLLGAGGQRLIKPGKDGQYYTYNMENGQPVKSKYVDGNFEDLLPNFYFAPEILKEVAPHSYETISEMGEFVTKVAPLTMLFLGATWNEKGTLTLTENGKLDTVSSVASMPIDEERYENVIVTAKFSEISTTKIDIDFSSIDQNLDKTSWNDYPELAAELQKWGLLDIVPFVDCAKGYSTSLDATRNGEDVRYVAIAPYSFDNVKDNKAYQDKFIAALKANGFTDNGDVDPEFGYTLYTKGSYQIGIGNFQKQVVFPKPGIQEIPEKSYIVIRSPLLKFPA